MNLAVNGEVQEPASGLGEHVNDCWPELVGPADRSLVHWLRRLVFRSAWLDQRVKEGELDVSLRLGAPDLLLRAARPRRRARRAGARAELGARVLHAPQRGLLSRPLGAGCLGGERLRAVLGDRRRLARADERLDAQRVSCRARAPGGARAAAAAASSRIVVVSPPSGSRAAAMTVSVPPSGTLRAAASARRAAGSAQLVERVDDDGRVAAARGDALGRVDRAVDRLGLGVWARCRGRRRRAGVELGGRPLGELLGTRAGEHDAAARCPPRRRARSPAGAASSCGPSRRRR